MRWILFACLIVVCSPAVLYAQNEIVLPPDPTTLFVDGLQVTTVEPYRGPRVDNQRRIVSVYIDDQAEWREYPLPANVDFYMDVYKWVQKAPIEIWIYAPISDSQGYDRIAIPSRTYILNLDTGEYQQPEAVCGNFLKAEAGKGRWVFDAPADAAARLCFTEDGSLKDPLPAEYDWGRYALERNYYPVVSPSGEWLILTAQKVDQYGALYILSYELSTGQIHVLGTMEGDSFYSTPSVLSDNWHDPQHGWIVQAFTSKPASTHYYSFDVTQADSLQFRFSYPSYSSGPLWTERGFEVLDSPELVSRFTGSARGDDSCHYSIYGPDSEQRFEIAYDCVPTDCRAFWQLDDSIVLMTIDSPESTTSSLVTFNPQSAGTFTLLEAEIERILGVSPDGRYVALLVENDGELNPEGSCYSAEIDHSASRSRSGRLYIYDLQGRIMQLTDNAGEFANQVWWSDSGSITAYMLGYSTDLDLPSGDRINAGNYQTVLVYASMNDGRFDRSVTYYDLRIDESQISPDGRYLRYEADGQIYILDLATQNTTGLLQMDTVRENGYEIYANWSLRENSLLLLRVKDFQTEFRIELPSAAPPR